MLQNELAILEFIHCLVETLDRYFSNVCELDLMFNLEMVCILPVLPGLGMYKGIMKGLPGFAGTLHCRRDADEWVHSGN